MFRFLKDFERAMQLAQDIDPDRFAYDRRYRNRISAVLRQEFAGEGKDRPKH